MARVLITSTPASGHINPLIAIGHELQQMGHHVVFATDESFRIQLEQANLSLRPLPYPPGAIQQMLQAFRKPVRWLSQFQRKPPQSYFLMHLSLLTTTLVNVIDQFSPDVIVTDLNFYAGGIAADATGVPYATYCAVVNTLVSPDTPPYGLGSDWYPEGHWRRTLWPLLNVALQTVLWRHDRQINAVRNQYGLKPVRGGLLAHSPYLSLVPTTDAYAYPRRHVPSQIVYVGPVTTPVRGEIPDEFPYEWIVSDGRPTVYVSMGTIVQGIRVFQEVIKAARGANWKAILAVGRQTDLHQFSDVPDNVMVTAFVPQLEVLKHVDAVVSHGGNNTVTETLLHGLPLVVIPISADQPESAARIKASGAGIRLRLSQAKDKKLRQAIEIVLRQTSYRREAKRIQKSFQSCNGPQTSARLISKLAIDQHPVLRPKGLGPTITADEVEKM